MGLLRRRPDISQLQFREHWRSAHADVARTLAGLRRYEQNHVVDSAQLGIAYPRGGAEYDGFSQLWFDDLAAMGRALQPEAAAALAGDEKAFIGDLSIVVTERTVVIEPPADGGLIKRMSLLTRLPSLTSEQFAESWCEHADLVRLMPGVAGYAQSVVIGRSVERHGKSGALDADYAELPIDGVVELWFHDADALQAAFASEAGQRTMRHATTFLDTITTYLVQAHRIM